LKVFVLLLQSVVQPLEIFDIVHGRGEQLLETFALFLSRSQSFVLGQQSTSEDTAKGFLSVLGGRIGDLGGHTFGVGLRLSQSNVHL